MKSELDELAAKFEEIETEQFGERWIRRGAEENGRDRDESWDVEPRDVYSSRAEG